MSNQAKDKLDNFNAKIIHCNDCTRLVDFRTKIAISNFSYGKPKKKKT